MSDNKDNPITAYLQYMALWNEFYVRNVFLPWVEMFTVKETKDESKKEDKR